MYGDCGKKKPMKLHFTDEKILKASYRGVTHQLAHKGDPVTPIGTDRWGPRVMIWGIIGRGFRFLHVFDSKSRLDSEEYQKVLKKVVTHLKRDGRVMQQDGATCHTSRSTRDWLAKQGVAVLEGWPPYSPDLNVIENLWDYLARKTWELIADKITKGKGSLKANAEILSVNVVKAWNAIPDDVMNRFLDSYEHRLKKCVALKGGYVQL